MVMVMTCMMTPKVDMKHVQRIRKNSTYMCVE